MSFVHLSKLDLLKDGIPILKEIQLFRYLFSSWIGIKGPFNKPSHRTATPPNPLENTDVEMSKSGTPWGIIAAQK